MLSIAPDIKYPTQLVTVVKLMLLQHKILLIYLILQILIQSYACTYFPWIQMRDTQNNVNVYIPPTGEVVKAMAFTDNTSFPWFAPAGLTPWCN